MSQQAPSSYVPFRLIQLKLFRLPASCSLFHALVLPIPVHLSRFGRHPGPQRKTVCTKKGSLLKKRRRRTQKKKKKKSSFTLCGLSSGRTSSPSSSFVFSSSSSFTDSLTFFYRKQALIIPYTHPFCVYISILCCRKSSTTSTHHVQHPSRDGWRSQFAFIRVAGSASSRV